MTEICSRCGMEFPYPAESHHSKFECSLRCAPSERELFDLFTLHGDDDPETLAGRVVALYATLPTIREAKAEGWDGAVKAAAFKVDSAQLIRDLHNPYRSEADQPWQHEGHKPVQH